MDSKEEAVIGTRPAAESASETVSRLERRVARLEAQLGLSPLSEGTGTETAQGATPEERQGSLELRIGEFYLAQAGVLALVAGTGFLITYFFKVWPAGIAAGASAGLLAGFFLLSALFRLTYPQMSFTLFSGALVLFYYSTLKLNFFTPSPLFENRYLGLAPVAGVLALQAVCAVWRRSQFLAAIALLSGYATALIADGLHLTLAGVATVSALAVYFRLRHDWDRAAVAALFAAYAAHLLWLFGNPFLGHPASLRVEGDLNLVYLFVYAALFAGANLFRSKALACETSNIVLSLFNALSFYLICLLVIYTYHREQAALLNLSASGFLLAAATAYWLYRRSFYSSSFYALTGFFALSVAIADWFQGPQRFIVLEWQSVLVIMTAIWYRSRLITVANLVIFLSLYMLYLLTGRADAMVHLSCALVAIVSARLLNWQTGQLDFGTESLRNAYLLTAFVALPIGLYLAVPRQFVSLSWVGASLFYFAMSVLLKNWKYRWMGILNFLLTAGYVVLVDLAKLDLVYRIISFVGLGLVLVVVSFVYADRRRRRVRQDSAGRPEAHGGRLDPAGPSEGAGLQIRR
jgi:hypothetical protein